MSDESEPSPGFRQLALITEVQPIADHPLLQVEPREEGGVTAQYKFGYQLELATYTCIEMLLPEKGIVSVAVELHEDYVVVYDDGHYDFRQVKHKDEGQRANLNTLAEPLHNLYEHFNKYPQLKNIFSIQCNRGAYPAKKDNLLQLKSLLTQKRSRALDPADENRLKLLKNTICQLPLFQGDDPACIYQFVEQLAIRTDEDSEEAFKSKSKQTLAKVFQIRHRTPVVDMKAVDALYDAIYLTVERASGARDDRMERIISREKIEDLIPPTLNMAELVATVSIEKERQLLNDSDPDHTILESKCHESDLDDIIDTLKDAKIDARIRNDQYCENNYALNYINRVRKGIKRLFDDVDLMSIVGSSDPAIVGKVIRSELRQKVARNSDRPFNLDRRAQAIAIPFSPRFGRSLAR